MKRSIGLILITLAVLAGWLFYRHKPAPDVSAAHKAVSVAIPAEVSAAAHSPSVVKPVYSAVQKDILPQEAPVQVVSEPGARFQLIDAAQILDQRITDVSKDRKKRELLVRGEGKYPFRRVEETLQRNESEETYTIASRTEMVADHVLVKLQPGKSKEDLQAMLEGYGISILRELTLPGHYIVSLKAPTLDAVPEALSVFAGEMELLAYVEPDYFSHITAVPNDSSWSNLWGMVKINATGAWDTATGSTNVIVAVIDSGIDLTHPDLVSNLWVNVAEANGTTGADNDGNGYTNDVNGWDFANDDKNPADDVGHGTHCAGTIGAVGNNGLGVAGVCWRVRLMALKALGTGGGTASDIAEAVHYAADKGAKIISASYGGSSYSDTEREAILYANSKGVLFVAAAGNDGANNDLYSVYPAGYDIPNIVAVAATDQADHLASFSNYGKTSVDLAAPGVAIYSTVPGGTNAEYSLGTSMAAPHVSGAAALLLSYKPSLTHLQLKQALLKTVDPVDELASKTVSGGRLNVRNLIVLLDTDGDGIPDDWETAHGLNPSSSLDASLDPDTDGLSNLEEYSNGTDPADSDTDGDTLPDGWEVTYGFNPNSPTGGLAASSSLGAFGISGGSKNVAVAGDYAYVAAGSAGLIIVNVSNPESPVLVGSYTARTANDVAVSNGYAYVASGGNADGTNGLLVLNVLPPSAPARAGFLKTAGAARGVAIQGNYAYLADGLNELVMINVSNPAAPSQAGKSASVIRNFADVFVSGSSAYIAMDTDVKRYNISNPASISHTAAALGGYTGDDVLCVHGNGTVLAAAVGAKGVSLLNPNTANLVNMPKLIPGDGLYDTAGTASGVFVSGNYVYVADGGNGLVVLDISTPSAPAQVIQVSTVGFASGVFVSGDKVYVATSAGVEIFSILLDSDGDGLPDSWEIQYFGDLSRNGTLDWDGDGISDRGEYLAGTHPKNTDTDGDGLSDGIEVFTHGTNPAAADTDGDGLSDGEEVLTHGTDPLLADTDGDGFSDGFEIDNGFDPLVPENPAVTDHDGDGLTDAQEAAIGTDVSNRFDPIFVDDDGPNDLEPWNSVYFGPAVEDGTITNAYDSIQEAIDSTNAVNGITILVNDGAYDGIGNYAIDTRGKALKIRSMNGAAVTEINSYEQGPVFNLTSGGNTNTLIQGFSITPLNGRYSAVILNNASIRIDQCRIYDSRLSGIECLSGASPVVSSCTVYNVSNGIYSASGSRPAIVDSTISNCTGRGILMKDNTAPQILRTTVELCAGGIQLDTCGGLIERCVIRGNSVTNGNGAGIALLGIGSPKLVNLLIAGNQASGTGVGGGLYIGAGSTPTNINCTIAGNSAGSGGGLANYGDPTLVNMIIWSNSATVTNVGIFKGTTSISLKYSCVQGGYSPVPSVGSYVITNNPLFVGGGDYHLASTNSPCYNKGTVNLAPIIDLDGNLRPLAGSFDMGCYEGISSGGGTDTDGDGMPDTWENANGLNPLVNDAALDPDGDGLTNLQEYNLGTNPQVADTDGDTMPDGWEFTYMPPLSPTNSLDGLLDSDLDGLTNKFEYSNGCDPTNSDTDADGLPDGWEVRYTLSPTNAVGADGATGDPDSDTLTNLQEYNLGTNPQVADTDGDGFADNVEISMGTLPTNGHDPVFVDDDAPGDLVLGNPNISDPLANGSPAHPFDSIQKAISTNTTVSGMTIFVTNGLYEGTGNYSINPLGKNLRILASGTGAAIKTHAYGSAFVINSGETTNMIIRGFTMETFGDESPEEGIVVDGSSPSIENCVIHNCELEAISCINGAAPRIINCRLYDALYGSFASGSAGVLVQGTTVSNTLNRGIVITGDDSARITGSTVEYCAGGMTLDGSDARVEECIIRNNTNVSVNGAGVLIQNGSSPMIRNALIVGNRAASGGGIYVGAGCNPTGVNCTVADNSAASNGGGVSSAGRPVFRNMIFWGNTAAANASLHVSANVIDVWYSDIQYGHSNAVSSVTNNPLFVGGGDYHLASTNSPSFNSGDFYLAPTNDLAGNSRPTALPQKVDMGCYEGISSPVVSDTDGDGMPDSWESAHGLNPAVNDAALDPDGDGLTNLQEYTLGTDPQDNDTDNDTMLDGWEVANGFNPLINDAALDTDSDGLSDYYEITTNAAITNLYITLPNNPDTDGDTMPDGWEVHHGLNPTVNDAALDPDGDGLTNLQEYPLGTDPQDNDSDNDGLTDGAEVNTFHTQPTNGRDPVFVDDNAATDPMPGEPNISSTNENGSITYPFDSIQEAIDWTNIVNGMTILVTNGTYKGTGNFNINPRGKSVQIRSVNGSANTFIITHAYGSAFVVNSSETTNTVVSGFTIETQGDRAPEEGVVVSGSSPVLQDLVIHNCELEAVSCLNGAAPHILNSRFYDVPSGLYANGSAGVLLQQSIISNTSGRGIVILNDNLAQVTWSTIEDCAGGITLDNSDASIRQCIIRNNDAPNYYTSISGVPVSAPVLFPLSTNTPAPVDTTSPDENGAGILILNESSPLLRNCLIVGNNTWADDPAYSDTATYPSFGLGAGVYIGTGCNPTGVNCTVADNHANTRGGGVSSAGRPLFRNMILWDNTSSHAAIVTDTNGVASRVFSSGADSIHLIDEVINIWYSDIEGGYANEVLCINSDPLFVGGGNYSLQAGSPCVDAGTFYLAPVVDLATNSRPTITNYYISSTNRVDMGCYERGAAMVTNYIALGAQIPQKDPVSDPQADTDGDGFTDSDEMVAGTDSLKETDYFRVTHEQSIVNGSVLISWQSVPGSLYTVQTTTNLMGSWSNVSGSVDSHGTGSTMSFTGTMTSHARYYRVQVRLP